MFFVKCKMSDINKLILELRLHFDGNKFDPDDYKHILHLMKKNGVYFDHGTDHQTNRHDWELDDYEGPLYSSPSYNKSYEHRLPPKHLFKK